MSIKTPKHWEKMKLTEATTAYGHKVMIPERFIEGWKGIEQAHRLGLKNGADLSIGVETFNQTAPITHERRNALMVFYEKYQRNE